MFRRMMAGLAVFAAGSAAGFVLSPNMSSRSLPAESPPKLAVVQASPAPAETPKSTTASAPLPAAASEPLDAQVGASAPSSQTATNQRPSAGQVIIAAVKPDASPQREWAAPAKTAAIKIAHVGGANPALQNNPIVMRELSRDIQQELYRVGCHSVSHLGQVGSSHGQGIGTVCCQSQRHAAGGAAGRGLAQPVAQLSGRFVWADLLECSRCRSTMRDA